MNNQETNNFIISNLRAINRNLIMNKLDYKTWDGYQQYFGEVLNLGILRIEDSIRFALSLYYSRIIPFTTIEEQKVKTRKEGIKSFINKASNNEYLATHNITKENIGELYREEMIKAIEDKQELKTTVRTIKKEA